MIGCVQRNHVFEWKDFRLQRDSNRGPLDQLASTEPAEVSRLPTSKQNQKGSALKEKNLLLGSNFFSLKLPPMEK